MRPVGKHIRAVMELLDADGPLSYIDLFSISDLDRSENATKYLRRCVAMGYATVDTTVFPRLYKAAPDWRKAIDAPRVLKPVIRKPVAAHKALSCFFAQMGEQHREELNASA